MAKFKKSKPAYPLNHWVKVTGVLGLHNNKPQIVIEKPSQIQLLRDEKEAKLWIQAYDSISAPGANERTFKIHDEQIFNILYGKKPAVSTQTSAQNKASVPPHPTLPIYTQNKLPPQQPKTASQATGQKSIMSWLSSIFQFVMAAFYFGIVGFAAGAFIDWLIGINWIKFVGILVGIIIAFQVVMMDDP